MADTTEPVSAAATPPVVPSTGASSGLPPAPHSAEERMDERQAYQPVSILAVVGLGMATVYAVVLGLLGVIFLSKQTPLILSGAYALLSAVPPVLAILICLAAWLRIQASEGTLGGRRLALWGIGLALVFGLGYWAYFWATSLAVKRKADDVGLKWLTHLEKGETEAAFWWALTPLDRGSQPPAGSADDPNMRKVFETRFNSGEGGAGSGRLSQFERQDLILILRQAGPNAKIESAGATDWGYQADGYFVMLEYLLTGDEGTFRIKLTLNGNEAQHQEFSGRQWFVIPEKAGLSGDPKFTDHGIKMMRLRKRTQQFLENWKSLLQLNLIADAFLETCDPKDRDDLRRTFRTRLAAGVAKALGMSGCDSSLTQFLALAEVTTNTNALLAKDLPGYKEYTEGSLVRADGKLWVSEESERNELVKNVKALFAKPGSSLVPAFDFGRLQDEAGRPRMWVIREENGRYLIEVPVTIAVAMRLPDREMAVEGRLYVEAPTDGNASSIEGWRLSHVDLLRAKEMTGGQNRGGGRGGRRGMRPPTGRP